MAVNGKGEPCDGHEHGAQSVPVGNSILSQPLQFAPQSLHCGHGLFFVLGGCWRPLGRGYCSVAACNLALNSELVLTPVDVRGSEVGQRFLIML